MANLLPQNVPHETTRDVVIDGYTIPKGTTIIPQISCVLYDEKVSRHCGYMSKLWFQIFPDPKRFDPSRFLDADGHLKRVDELIPFSIGKRQCLGEGLARMELFLILANIFNQFRVSRNDLSCASCDDFRYPQALRSRLFSA